MNLKKTLYLYIIILSVLVSSASADSPKSERGYREAIKWYTKAAQQGDAAAQNNLGLMYAKGYDVVQDYITAHKWFNLASAQGDDTARTNRDQVEKKMTPAQIAEAQRLAREWKAIINNRTDKEDL